MEGELTVQCVLKKKEKRQADELGYHWRYEQYLGKAQYDTGADKVAAHRYDAEPDQPGKEPVPDLEVNKCIEAKADEEAKPHCSRIT